MFKGNDEAHWDRVADVFVKHGAEWAKETVPPSDR